MPVSPFIPSRPLVQPLGNQGLGTLSTENEVLLLASSAHITIGFRPERLPTSFIPDIFLKCLGQSRRNDSRAELTYVNGVLHAVGCGLFGCFSIKT